jgi:uncharacterized protein
MTTSLSLGDARRIALHAQGLRRRSDRAAGAGPGDFRKALARVHYLQIDAANVVARAHYLTMYSRVGPYPVERLDRYVARRQAFEYKSAHIAMLIATPLHPLFRWCMDPPRAGNALALVEARRPGYVDSVLRDIADRGPLAYTELADPGRVPKDQRQSRYAESSLRWSSWSMGDAVLNALAAQGVLATSGRKGFEPRFDLTERVIPAEVLALPTPAAEDAKRELVRLAARAVGLGTAKDVAGYFRLKVAEARLHLRDLVAAGELEAVRVEGWKDAAFLARGATAAAVDACTLLSPFDSLLWERSRTVRLFGFEQAFELYVPAAKRRYGYYVMPFLLGDRPVARVDLKADRPASTLVAHAAFAEDGVDAAAVADALAAELRTLAGWLALATVAVGDRGDLAPLLGRAVAASGRLTPRQ